ncbi:MAG TPA: DNA topoisomerase IB [Dokdonella sp.]
MRLRYVTDAEPGYRRERRGKGFAYVDHRGRPLKDARVLARIRALAIPPAYTDVWICPIPHGHLQATARDARGRKQYRYHAEWRRARDETKFARTIAFAEALPALRRRVARDLRLRGVPREKVLAAIVRLLDRTRIRVGNEEYARANGSYGLSTMRNRHVSVHGDEVRFLFRGKSGRKHEVALSDKRVAAVLRRCRDLPGQHLFQYVGDGRVQRIGSGDVNAYLREVMRGDFTAKDFRTWSASVVVARELVTHAERGEAADLKAAIAVAAETLGNTPAVCRRAYLHPAVAEAGEDPRRFERLQAAFARAGAARGGLDRNERALLRYLRGGRRKSG